MKKILIVIFSFISVFGYSQTRKDTVLSAKGDRVVDIKPLIGTVAQLRANTNPTYVTGQTTDLGTGSWYYVANGTGYTDNTGTVLKDARGGAWVRVFDGNTLQVEWFGVKGDGVTDNTDSLQKAVNASYKKTLAFRKDGVYIWNKVYLPSGITINGNGCKIVASDNFSAGAMFYFEPYRNSLATGIYAGGPGQPVVKPAIRNVDLIDISGFNVDLKMSRLNFFSANNYLTPNTVIKNIKIHDNNISNFAVNAISIGSDSRVTDSTSLVQNFYAENNNIRYNGMVGLYVVNPGVTGDTTITVATEDKNVIEPRLKNSIGKYFWIGSPIVALDTLDDNGYNTTNVYFRLKSYTVNVNDSTQANILLEGGSYDNTNGWIANTGNTGLKARIARYNMLTPIDPQSGSLMFYLPQFSASSGATTLNRTTVSTQQDAYHKNLTVGQKFSTNDGIRGSYTITGVTSSTITITPALNHAITGISLLPYTNFADCIAVAANVQNVYVRGNTGYGANHFLGIIQAPLLKKWQEENYARFFVENNEWKYMWMGVESPSPLSRVYGFDPFSNLSVSKGDTSITISSGSARIGSKDMGSGAVKFITASATIDPNVTNDNSFFVGDVLMWYGEHYRMVIQDIYLNAGNPTVSLRRFDTYNKVAITDSGFSATVSNLRPCLRIFNKEYGQGLSTRYMLFQNNHGYYTTRNAGGTGYQISCQSYDMDVLDNKFYQSETNAIELHAVNLRVENNLFESNVWDGSEPRPSLTKRGGTYGISFKGWGAAIASIGIIRGNTFKGKQPPTANYDFRAGNILLQPGGMNLEELKSMDMVGNTFDGVGNQIINIVDQNTINGTTYPVFYYDKFNFTNNTIKTSDQFPNYGWANNMLTNKNLMLQNNTIIADKKYADIKVFLTNYKPNTELFDSTNAYSIRIENNYDTTANLNSVFMQTHAGVFWNDNRPTLDRAQTFTNKTMDNPSITNLTGSGVSLIYNATTNKIERTTISGGGGGGSGASLKGTID